MALMMEIEEGTTEAERVDELDEAYKREWRAGKLKTSDDGVMLYTVKGANRIVVPMVWPRRIIEAEHRRDHQGASRTAVRIRLHFYWGNMTREIEADVYVSKISEAGCRII